MAICPPTIVRTPLRSDGVGRALRAAFGQVDAIAIGEDFGSLLAAIDRCGLASVSRSGG